MRIRHFGFLANVCKKENLEIIRSFLGEQFSNNPKVEQTLREMMLHITGIDITLCPRCKSGTMVVVGPLPRVSLGHDPPYRCVA